MHLKEIDANLLVVLDSLLVDASVTKAAERLGRSPSAVSHALANLREIFQDELFVRAGQRLVATAKAQELAPTVHIICAGIEGLLRPEIPFEPQLQERTFIFACPQTYELSVLGETRRTVRQAAAGIDLECRPYDSEQSLEDLRQNTVQFVVTEDAPREDAADFVWRPFNSERYVTVGSAGHPSAGKRVSKTAFEKLEHILIAREADAPKPVLAHLECHGVAADKLQIVPSVFTALLLALESDSLATLPQSTFRAVGEKLDLAEIKPPFPQFEVQTYIGWHRSQDRDECHEWVRSQLLNGAMANGKD
ncbi:MAG: LysR family transcriptional regulator [Hyphomicrobiaceae bacterium]|nr:LysR family transcriptional regulator [Hyphomicrobiaceae bacterium]